MADLKDIFMKIQTDEEPEQDAVEVYADSVRQALNLASKELGIDVGYLDYRVLEKGARGFFGIGRLPYRVLITPMPEAEEYSDLDELEKKLSGDHLPGVTADKQVNANGSFKIRVTKTGMWLTITPAKGSGKPVQVQDVHGKLYSMKAEKVDMGQVDRELNKKSGKPVKIGEWVPNSTYDGSMKVEITDDEMKAFIHFTPPRFAGRHMEFDEVVEVLKNNGVVVGINENRINEYLEKMDYGQPLIAAEGEKHRNGRDSYVDYKVRIDNTGINFEEDESGKVDFRNLELLENVVVGQLLALKVPAEEGTPGRTVTNRIIPSKSGKDAKMQYGKGTILSEDGTELTAEINGQVVFKNNKISVEPVYVVPGDVSLETGNIVFLGSVIIQGNVQDNFVVKAAGNIEVKGTVQKAFLEAEGDIFLRSGLMGRDEAKIESTGGSIYSKFIQNSNVIAENNVIVPEGIVHSFVDAGENIFTTGKRARIVGGRVRAGSEVNARFLGADVSTKTEIWVGINPKILQQISELSNLEKNINEELSQVKLNLKSLEGQQRQGRITSEKKDVLEDLKEQDIKLSERHEEVKSELDELKSYVEMIEHKGKICAEKVAYAGVEVHIKDKKFPLKDPYNHVKFSMEGGEIKISEYELPAISEAQSKMVSIARRR